MMRHTLNAFRPATAAIAAVLVLATSPAIAQDAVALPPVDEPAPAPVPAPEVALPVLMPQAAPAPVIPPASQATEVVQTMPAAAPEDIAPVTPRAQQRAQAPAAAQTTQPTTVAAPAQPTAPVLAPQSVAIPAPADLAPVSAPAVPAEPVAVSATDESVYWAIGGATLLLLGGLAAYALSNRRKPVAIVPAKERAARAPLVTSSIKPADLSFEPVEVTAPPLAVEPAIGPATGTPRAAMAVGSWSPLEEMVAAPPSPENPFLTRKARLRRASYILSKGIPEPLYGDAQPVRERVEEKQFKPQQAYNFGKAQSPPRFSWKPATS